VIEEKSFPDGMVPLGDLPFRFSCHPGVACFTVCCRNVDLDLYPYDILRLKNSLAMDSQTFLETHTRLQQGGNPFFPTVKLQLVASGSEWSCPFLCEQGCRVYRDRPTACRTYPLERAVERAVHRGSCRDWYFLKRHDYCLGHRQDQEQTVRRWLRSQRLEPFNLMNDLWSRVDTLLASNPFQGEGSGGPRQQLTFLACYNIDGFRNYLRQHRLLDRYPADRDRKRRIERSDEELLKFAFEWVQTALL
jgi:uncharacterized protein